VFRPELRDCAPGDKRFVIGYVGRITSETGVRLLADIEPELDWLLANLKRAEFPGVVKGEALAREYANVDLFVFPSRTDTFGNVVIEASASRVPALVTDACGRSS
jgi:glycosyltransferase involved in cell wall biosynthesis